MRQSGKRGNAVTTVLAMLVAAYGLAPIHASGAETKQAKDAADSGGDYSFSLTGYLRGWASFNMDNQPELKAIGEDSAGKLSMLRGSMLLDADARTGPIKWKAIGRLDREHKTSYLNNLEKLRATNGTAGGDSILDNYNQGEIREFWAEMPIGERTTVKFGKQQLVWGESDFFHAMDLVHGYDLSWRLFFEGENEEWRKPLIMLSTKIRIPEAKGMLAAYVRPGWDRCQDIGNTYDIRGGRWFFQPYRGFDLSQVTDKDCNHKEGDYDDVTYGVRWSGEAFDLNYSLAYLTTFAADPVANSTFRPWKERPTGAVFDLIHPKIDVLGATVSGYSAALDSVLSAEVAYTKDQPYNIGSGAFNPGNLSNPGIGLNGVKLKDTLTTMIRIDKNLNLENILGTSRPSFSSIQIFNTQILNFDKQDDIVRLFAYGNRATEHNTIVTAFTTLNYRNDTINPGLAVGFDVSHGGGFAIPSVSLVLNDKWLAKIEADIFWTGGKHNDRQFSGQASQLFGYFNQSNQLVFRLTRQF
ncbi:MAG TPA: LysR family transcriptional regulator [Rhodocyclaceae bacterium]|nr:LysR family transcriptional regulator [Rhodocyclaceae bacterium]HNA03763.1 LysR family transcriptional regulator [Rhodocyclaceae bacterium]HNB78011.1 LysR family transcriptional regulator [Rhodocyclaceae bacterium]HNC62395.1 LysR family transcriptional regulator [Rhodocyclaceae bacterium]HNH12112.1 LysR family transcriptional regulator [Rhodocyclaceae bacterium]